MLKVQIILNIIYCLTFMFLMCTEMHMVMYNNYNYNIDKKHLIQLWYLAVHRYKGAEHLRESIVYTPTYTVGLLQWGPKIHVYCI